MKKAWMIALGAGALVAALVCWAGASLADSGAEPVLTQQLECVVLAKSSRELVVRAGTELRTIRLVKAARAGGSEAVQVGDLVQLETELHSDNTETLRNMRIITEGELSAQEAADLLTGGQAVPEAVAFDAQPNTQTQEPDAGASSRAQDATQDRAQYSDSSISDTDAQGRAETSAPTDSAASAQTADSAIS